MSRRLKKVTKCRNSNIVFRLRNELSSSPHSVWAAEFIAGQPWHGVHLRFTFSSLSHDLIKSTIEIRGVLESFLLLHFEELCIGTALRDPRFRHPVMFAARNVPVRPIDFTSGKRGRLEIDALLLIPLQLGAVGCFDARQFFPGLYSPPSKTPPTTLISVVEVSQIPAAGPFAREFLKRMEMDSGHLVDSIILPRFLRQQTMYHCTNELLRAYDAWIRSYLNSPSWQGTFLTFKFNSLAGSASAIIDQMSKEIEHFFAGFITRVMSNPTSPSAAGRRPILIAAPDRPVIKGGKKTPLADLIVNDGCHYHGILLTPSVSRLKHSASEEIAANQRMYIGRYNRLREIYAEPIAEPAADFVGYTLKGVVNLSDARDKILILPKITSELRKQ